MKIFVAGGNSFIGSYLINELLIAKHEVSVLVRPNSKFAIPLIAKPNLIIKELEQVSINDLIEMEVVFNLISAGVSPKKASWETLEKVNIAFAIKLMEYSKKANVKRFIATGSCLEYGNEAEKWDFIPPNASLKPITPYASTKAAGFILMNTFAKQNPIEFFYGRIFYAFGKGQYEKNFYPSLINAALSGEDFKISEGSQVLDFIEVEAVAKHLRIAAERNDIPTKEPLIVNIGSGEGIKLRDFARNKWELFKAKGKLKIGEYQRDEITLKRLVANTTKLNQSNTL